MLVVDPTVFAVADVALAQEIVRPKLHMGAVGDGHCRGPWCILSFEAVAQLRGVGLEARRLENGLPEWRRAGLPVESD